MFVRPVVPADLAGIACLLDALSVESRYRRWFSAAIDMDAAARWAVHPPDGIAVVAVVGTEIVGHAALVPSRPGRGEVAFEVASGWRRHGIATRLLLALEDEARRRGIATLEADVLATNADMLAVFTENATCTRQRDSAVVHITFPVASSMTPRSGVVR